MVDQYSPPEREPEREAEGPMLMNRRSFLAGAGGVALTTLLAGCQRGTDANLRLAMLANSVPAQLLRAFQQLGDQGGNVAVNPQDSLVKLYSLLQGWHHPPDGATVAPVADWVSLADYWLAPAIQQNLIKPLNVSSLTSWKSLAPVWPELVRRSAEGLPSTDGDIWAMPYRWSHLVLLYDATRLPRDQALSTWADLLRPELTRRVILPDHPRLVIGLAQKAVGASANSADPDAVQGLKPFLNDLHQQVRAYDTDHYLEALIVGDATAVVGWSDDVLPLLKQYQQLAAVVPPEGTLLSAQLWVQSEAIPEQSPLALNWLDFCLGDDFAKQLAIYGQSTSPSLWGVGPNDLPQPLQQPATQVLLPEVADQSEFLLPLTPEAEARYSDLWQNLRSKAQT
ncbi:extracellular solute-binding protein [Nodosilinea sp. LEGE 07088]|uniref:substrate-binding domain-containing protein n=1 Tax=Nodosilinea sp. LEGE 07088 TaxID=2777968 RepID=UPI00188179AC|nr:substrate-binding domain-containing protein [Nodosilinea sp. LEGE 07088]MBE9137194.1 extracellular solute-binding protein [Nodosilinea sp. LEGE 07088]